MAYKKKASDEEIISAYQETGSLWAAAKMLGMCGQSVHERMHKMGHPPTGMNPWSEDDLRYLKANYETYACQAGGLDELSQKLKRKKTNVCKKARDLGLTNIKRHKTPEHVEKSSFGHKIWYETNEHPRGMAGKTHSPETKADIGRKSKQRWEEMTESEKDSMLLKRAQTAARLGSSAPRNREKCSWKAAWREIGGIRKYYRSRWEANYARYLQFLLEAGHIQKWEHEPETFWFEGIKRGCLSYLPDFRVTNNDGSVEYHEVKGWMDKRSKTKIKRMAKYHPEVKLLVIAQKQYMEIRNKLGRTIPGWEE